MVALAASRWPEKGEKYPWLEVYRILRKHPAKGGTTSRKGELEAAKVDGVSPLVREYN
jgi:hypothetical protein